MEKINEYLNEIKRMKANIINLLNDNDIEKANIEKEKIENIQKKIDVLLEIENISKKEVKEKINKKETETKSEVENLINFIKNKALGLNLPVNAGTVKISEDGGFIVPEETSKKIMEFRKSGRNIENEIFVMRVNSLKGNVPAMDDGTDEPFDIVNEGEAYDDSKNPKFQNIKYAIEKFGGITKYSVELFKGSNGAIQNIVTKWLGNKAVATINSQVFKVLDTDNASNIKSIANAEDITNILDVELENAIIEKAIIVTNQDGLNFLKSLKDANGVRILQKDVTQKFAFLFEGLPIKVFSNKILKTTTNKVPFYIGDFKEGIILFDYNQMILEFSKEAGFTSDQILAKARMLLDVKIANKNAIIKAEYTKTGRSNAKKE